MITLDLSILNQKGTPIFYSDTLALRPAFGIVGRIFIAIDSPYGIFRDTGTAWDQIAGSGGGGIGGSGTATQIAFFNAANTLTSSANLFWDNTNARLGVNTATPSSSLDVHSAVQSVIQANNTTLGNSFLSFQLQGTGKWQIGNVYNAGANYFRIHDQLNNLERLTIQNTGEIDFLGWQQTINTVTGITGTTPSALPNSGFQNDFTFNTGISTSASVNAIGLLVDNLLNYSGANTINATSYNASGLFRIGLTFGSASASITYTQGASAQIRALTSNQVQYIQNGNNSGTISHYANIQILGDNKSGSGITTFTNRYGLLINDFNDFAAGNTYTNRWGIYQQGSNESNFFAGKVGIGSGYTPGTFQLDVIGTTRLKGDTWIDSNDAGQSVLRVGSNTNVYTTVSSLGTLSSVAIKTNTGNTILKSGGDVDIQNSLALSSALTIGESSPGYNFLAFRGQFTTPCMFWSQAGLQFGNNASAVASAIVEFNSTTKGFLPPRMTTAQKNAIATPAAGLMIYDTTLNKLCVYTTAWETVTSV